MSFNTKITLHLALLVLTLFALVWALEHGQLWATSSCLALVIVIQLWGLRQLLTNNQRQLSQLFDALLYDDYSTKIAITAEGKATRDLHQKMTTIQQRLRVLRQDNETLLRYHQVMLEKVPVAIVVIENNDRIELINSAARKLFQRNALASASALSGYGVQLQRDLYAIAPGQTLHSLMYINHQPLSVSLSATQFVSDNGSKKIISLQPIQRELDERELQAWQELVQVFTHEIMNSMTPVVSLSNTASQLLENPQLQVADAGQELMADARQAIHRVARRAEHLMDFVQAYRQIAQLPVLNIAPVTIATLLEDVCQLFSAQVQAAQVTLTYDVTPNDLTVRLDRGQVEQVLINLIKNAFEALVGKPEGCINICAYISHDGKLVLDISDNGPGIAADKRAQIFVPFFTSKPEGTGVGLFVAKQIMQAHKGTVNALEAESGGALFRLVF